MVAPAMLAGVGMVGSAVSGLISGAGSLAKGAAGQAMYSYQAGVAQLNSKIALANRDYTYATGEEDAKRYGMGARQRMGAIRAGEGASGIDIGSGSKAAVQTGQQTVTNIDEATMRNNTARKAFGYQVEATQDTAQSQVYTMAGA